MPINNGFTVTEIETESVNKYEKQKTYTCDEAINLAGVGVYTGGLVATLSLSLMAMAVDMFGFSVLVTGSACDFDLTHTQKSLLMSTPFVGPIITSYVWGYISDTRGRRWSLLVGMWGGFAASVISAFSSHWVLLAMLRIVGTSFSSAAQSGTFTYLGESCPERLRGTFNVILTSVLMLFIPAYDVPAYFILNLSFRYEVGIISFTPWRLLALVIAAPMAISAVLLHFYCESPKFLVNAGREDEALEHLETMWRRNGNTGVYPVTKVELDEEMSIKRKGESFLASLSSQVLPLFKPPLLWRTLQLFYLTMVIYAINNSLVMWMPVIVEAFAAGLQSSTSSQHTSLCDIIVNHHANSTRISDPAYCVSSIDSRTLISGVAYGLIFSTATLAISRVGHRKKLIITLFLVLPLICSIVAVYNQNSVVSLVVYIGMISTNCGIGFLFGYFVDLYPTSYRGMASCLAVMVSRLSGLAGVHFLGALVMYHCTLTFYVFAGYLLSGVAVAYFLPPDIVTKKIG